MSRWLSRTVPASARRAGRAVAMVFSCACTVMMIPAFPAVTTASVALVSRRTRDVTIFPPGAGARQGRAASVSASS